MLGLFFRIGEHDIEDVNAEAAEAAKQKCGSTLVRCNGLAIVEVSIPTIVFTVSYYNLSVILVSCIHTQNVGSFCTNASA